jgi:hypothetical protein
MNKTVVGASIALLLSLTASHVLAHNAGHVHTPNGACRDVGSGKHAHNPEQQDKIPGPGDQYGARWAAEQGNTPIEPRHCDEEGAHNHPDTQAQDTP